MARQVSWMWGGKRHMQYMLNSMKRGATFTQAHKNAQKAVGK